MYRIVGVDPGGTTGVCVLDVSFSGDVQKWNGLELNCQRGSWEGERVAALKLADFLLAKYNTMFSGSDQLHLVVEDFILRGGPVGTTKREGLAPVRMTALVEGVLAGRSGPWFGSQVWNARQSAADAKGFGTKDRLVATGAWHETVGKPHARDAARHALLYAVRKGFIREM